MGRPVVEIKRKMEEDIGKESLAVLDYIEICEADTLGDVEIMRGSMLLALAVKIGNTRLIDNIILEV